jgi:hypothetical protein
LLDCQAAGEAGPSGRSRQADREGEFVFVHVTQRGETCIG